MNPLATIVISDAVTFALSMFSVLFIAGMRWAEMRRDLETIKRDIANIQGMFVVRIRSDRVDMES